MFAAVACLLLSPDIALLFLTDTFALVSPVRIPWHGGEGGIQSMLDGRHSSTMDGGGVSQSVDLGQSNNLNTTPTKDYKIV